MPQEPILLDTLTERELEIIALLAEESSNKEIANQLFLAPNTVKWYITQVNSKLATKNRHEIVERADELGLLQAQAEADSYLRPRQNLPRQTTPFIGRDAELDEIHQIIEKDEVRLLTILAQGGMGKTRIALEASEQQLNHFPDGVYFVPLQALSDVNNIVPQIATSTGFQFGNDGRPQKEQLVEFLANKAMLLCIDNWEHLLEGVDLINEILQSAPNVKVLATSREKLNLMSETVYVLQGMQYPDWETPEDALEYDAVQLLVQSAQRIKPDWDINQDNLDYVARVCRLTQGMPLGILLATSWLDVYSLQRISEEIQQSFDILETEMRDVPKRQRSIRAVFDYSWERLNSKEQAVLMKMSVFRGGCSPQAAEAVTGANARILQSLVNKALLLRNREGRYDVHELLRQYAEGNLDNAETIRDSHMEYYVDALINLTPKLKGGEQIRAFHDLETNFKNVRAAWYWARETEQWSALQEMIEPIWMLNYRGGTLEIARLFVPLMKQLRGLSQTNIQQELLIAWLAGNYLTDHDTPFAEQAEIVRVGLEHARKHQSPLLIASCINRLALILNHQGHYEEGEELLNEALVIAHDLDDLHLSVKLLSRLTFCHVMRVDIDSAHETALQSLEIAHQTNDKIWISNILGDLAVLLRLQNKRTEGQQMQWEALRWARETGNVSVLPMRLSLSAASYVDKMQLDKAKALIQELDELAKELNAPKPIGIALLINARIAYVEERFDENHKLLVDAETYLIREGNPTILRNVQHAIGISKIMVHDTKAGLQYLKNTLPALISTSTVAVLLASLVAFIHLLKQRGEDLRCIELISLIMNHSHSQPIDTQFSYTLGIQAELEAKLEPSEFQVAWERGKSMDLGTMVQELLDEFGEEK